MNIADILSPDRVVNGLQAGSKKRALELISEILAVGGLKGRQGDIFDSLIQRERLGSTGFGNGVAIPHGRVKDNTLTLGVFVKLQQPIGYDAIDGQAVDLIFALVVPQESTEEHLQVLAALAEKFGNDEFCRKLRDAEDAAQQYRLLTGGNAH
ncbi:MAG: PTS IIA-like nitrogen regulatory protein PtsN [Pseudomonadota bacterium]